MWGIRIEVAGVSFYHQGSANLIDDAVRDRGVDYFLAGVAGRGFTRDYWERILRRLEPRVVVPTHYDDFFRPLADPNAGFTTNVNLARVPDESPRRQPRLRRRRAAPPLPTGLAALIRRSPAASPR